MGGRPAREGRRLPYWLSFALVTLLLGALTAGFVLVVLPQRFVLHSGLRASGVSFPTRAPLFEPVEGVAVTPPPARAPASVPSPPAAEEPAALAVRPAGADRAPDERPPLERARLLRDGGDVDGAAALYRELIAARPSDPELRLELARALAWAERYEEAAAEYRALLELAPEEGAHRLELARVLYWAGRVEEASEEAAAALASLPEDAPEREEAEALRTRLAALMDPAEAPVGETHLAGTEPPDPASADGRAAGDADPLLAEARRAAAADETERARELYERLLSERPDDASLWREWADVLEYRIQDPEGARAALLRSGSLAPLEPETTLRLARLHAWTGHEEESLALLAELLEEDPGLAEAWVLQGDLYRWRGDRRHAAHAYRRALAADPEAEGAVEGLALVETETARQVAARERAGVGPELVFFRDSDGYRRLDVAARWSASHGTGALAARTGFRRLEGLGAGAAHAVEEGPFGEVELSRWWREGAVRAAVMGGAERLEATGVEPTFGLALEAWSPAGHTLEASYRHGAAYPLATTLESVVEGVRADRLQVAAIRSLGGGWSAGASGEAASLRDGEVDNWRLGGGASLFRRLSPALRLGVETRLLGYSEASPRLGDRRLYWDPRAFWSAGAALELAPPERNGWTAYGALRPGIAVVEERDAAVSETVPQLSVEGGVRYRTERFDLSGDLFHLRGREGDYDAFGLGLRFSVRP